MRVLSIQDTFRRVIYPVWRNNNNARMHNRNPECMDLQLVWRRYIFHSRNYLQLWIFINRKVYSRKGHVRSICTFVRIGIGKMTYSQLKRDGHSESLQHSWHFQEDFKILQQFPESQLLSSTQSPPFGVPDIRDEKPSIHYISKSLFNFHFSHDIV